MMKLILFLLLLANAALFALHQGYLNELIPSGREPARLTKQVHADKITLLSASVANSPPPPPPVPVQKAEIIACLEIGNFTLVEAKRFETQLATLALGDRQTRHNIQEVSSHIVYIPPLASKESADKKAGELRQLGITNYFIISEPTSPLRFGISLGAFKTALAAETHLANLNKQGVHSARVGTRSVNTNKLAFQLRNIDPDVKARLDKIKADFAAQEMQDCKKSA